ncbi:MAG: hypothetical protein K8R41_09245 [Bacteroidales bacterium]|nr:hypothetical protein [Bacteroidales bacterium]
MNISKKIFSLYLLFSFVLIVFSQKEKTPLVLTKDNEINKNAEQERVRLVFYNVENLFDIYDDPKINDEEFTPEGIRSWDKYKFKTKINNIFKTLIAVGKWKMPDIIGLCEIENYFVLEKLVNSTPLKNYNYNIIHYESPDHRGIDVALLYNPEKIQELFSSPLRINFPFDNNLKTRDILYVKALLFDSDTLHLFINHWPSRYGGLMKTIPKRNFVAGVLRQKVDSILMISPQANVVIMGDFNDNPDDESLCEILNASVKRNYSERNNLFNLMYKNTGENKSGSVKYKENWNTFDQIIVSGNMLNDSNRLKIIGKEAVIFNACFLFEEDKKYLGKKPFRTYSGYKYIGGFSDHFPVYIDLIKEN